MRGVASAIDSARRMPVDGLGGVRGEDRRLMQMTAAILMVLISLMGIGLTIFTLPGVWLAIAFAIGVKALWQQDMFSYGVLGTAIGLAALGEIIEFFASMAGAAKAGASRSGKWGALGGTIVGAIAGSFFLPPIGTVVGAVVGAGLGAMAAERGIANRSWAEAAKSGQGAAVGRFVATLAKIGIAIVVGGMLSVAAFRS